MMRLSQGQLSLLATCPRRFQHGVLDGLGVPPAPEQLAAQQWGDRFHLLMQQRELGLPLDLPPSASPQDQDLHGAIATLTAATPDLFHADPPETLRQSEHSRALVLGDYWFTVIYDLLRIWPQRGEIVDWKTYRQPCPFAALEQDWQTRLYCYVLAETSALTPDQITMVYWFVRPQDETGQPGPPQRVSIPYSGDRHAHTHQELLRLTAQLTQWRAQDQDWPQVPDRPDGPCDRCPFAVRCQRGSDRGPAVPAIPPLEAIPEVVPTRGYSI